MPATRHSLWVMPSGTVFDRLAQLINELGAEHSTPGFAPHVTVLGGIPVSEQQVRPKIAELAAAMEPFPVKLTELDCLDEYYRCLFIRVEATEEVLGAHRQASHAFGREPDPNYLPHLSLMYGDIARETKERIIERLGRHCGLEFHAAGFHLVVTEGPPAGWREVGEFPFANERGQARMPALPRRQQQ